MSDFFKELIGVKCDFETDDDTYYEYVLKDASGDWILIEDEEESLYLNLRYVISIKISQEDSDEESSKGFFRKRKTSYKKSIPQMKKIK